ncbi:MAG: DMT family transporter [Gammaproteobacteria bacterium]|nr:DMT family transporter [Gammaproteobacteria bacterium]
MIERPTVTSPTTFGMLWMLLSGLCFVGVTVSVRYVGPEVPAAQAAFLRYVLGTVMLAPVFYQLYRGQQQVSSWRIMIIRGVTHGIGVILWFYAMARIPIAEVTALGYLTPVLITAGAALFFGEKLHLRRIMAIVVGLVGVMIILRPGINAISEGQIAQLLATPLFAASLLLTKRMTSTESLTVIVAGLSLVCSVTLLPPALAVWVHRTPFQVFMLTITALLATIGHFTMTKAFSLAPITTLQPISFLQLLWATLFGALLFAESLNIYVFIGGALLVGATTYIAHREAIAARNNA